MGIKLHLGCFDRVVPGWVNTDITPHILIARIPGLPLLLHKFGKMDACRFRQHQHGLFREVKYLDVTRPLPYADGSVDAIFSCHLLEHIFPGEAENLLHECGRVLRAGGVCRVVVPCLDQVVRRYTAVNPDRFLEAIFETRERCRVKNAHHWGYTQQSLSDLMATCGFSQVFARSYREGLCPDLQLLDNRPDYSIFVEGLK